jgi:hyperosmotically inducible protein
MKVSRIAIGMVAASLGANAFAQSASRADDRIPREVRHELLSLPYFGVFDFIAFKVEGRKVTLLGEVTKPTLKRDAENAVKHIEDVEQVDDQIDVLPPSSMDEQLRLALYRAIYGYGPLEKYALGVNKPIRIIVRNGRVELKGVIDSEADKNMVGIRAQTVPGTFDVKNDLEVVKP